MFNGEDDEEPLDLVFSPTFLDLPSQTKSISTNPSLPCSVRVPRSFLNMKFKYGVCLQFSYRGHSWRYPSIHHGHSCGWCPNMLIQFWMKGRGRTHPEWQQGKMQALLSAEPSSYINLHFCRSYPCLSDSITNSCTPKVDQMEAPKCLGHIMPYPIMEKSIQTSMESQVPKRQLLGPRHVHASRSVRGEVFHPQ